MLCEEEEENYYDEISKYISECISDGSLVPRMIEYLTGLGATLVEDEDKK